MTNDSRRKIHLPFVKKKKKIPRLIEDETVSADRDRLTDTQFMWSPYAVYRIEIALWPLVTPREHSLFVYSRSGLLSFELGILPIRRKITTFSLKIILIKLYKELFYLVILNSKKLTFYLFVPWAV